MVKVDITLKKQLKVFQIEDLTFYPNNKPKNKQRTQRQFSITD